ncbi:RNA-directed DNA polymerase [Ramlibacter henchirensis]|uniref:RNA-directed DNA polymerase n=1 Tax=Ramlibacter henchirensis TaxID=204072 RepID=A0A4Z0BYH3_9BURK|nr:reverse transcriptase family protein [Ramlibacter henchirensis]TFZ02979.1 RNA-directed DNA polymerase [Ramlibacter henchirensis]
METWSAHHLFSAAATKIGVARAGRLAAYVAKLQRRNLPVITTLGHLAEIVGVSYSFLRQTVERKREAANYKLFAISKRSGGRRFIHEVGTQLLIVQRFLNQEVLQGIAPHPASFAFHSTGGIRKCAQMHCGASWLLHFDLKDFFYSISEWSVYEVFASLQYRPLLSFELARLCTTLHLPGASQAYLRPSTAAQRYSFYRKDVMGVLPQGAPTSPMLANLAAHDLDARLQDFADAAGMIYTRYADDLTFSTVRLSAPISQLQYEVSRQIGLTGFSENKRKRRVAGPGSRRTVLGLLVDGAEPKLSRQFIARVDRHLYAAKKYGLEAAASRAAFDSAFGFHNHLGGLVAYSMDAERKRGAMFLERLREIPVPWQTA